MIDNDQTLKALHESPIDRVLYAGARALSQTELLAVLLGDSALALRLLARFRNLRELVRALPAELQEVKGISRRRAAIVMAALELGRRAIQYPADERPQVRAPSDAAMIFMNEMSHLEQENLCVMLLDTRNRIIGIATIYQGSVNTTMVRVAEVIRPAVRVNSPAIIVAHNHPSGDPSPSPEDVAITREIIKAGELLGIEVLDHIVVGDARYVSLKERGLGFD